jgi:cobalt/nickel transport system permease protein
MAWPAEPRRSQALLAGGGAAAFALSAVTDPRLLAAAAAVAVAVFPRGFARTARRVAVSVLPVTLGLALASIAFARAVEGRWPDPAPWIALVLRASVITYVTLSVVRRADLFRALGPLPTATRLLVLTLAQAHALRLLATESLLGLRSRMPRRPGALDVLRGAGGVTAALLTLTLRNARDVADAMRSRGF